MARGSGELFSAFRGSDSPVWEGSEKGRALGAGMSCWEPHNNPVISPPENQEGCNNALPIMQCAIFKGGNAWGFVPDLCISQSALIAVDFSFFLSSCAEIHDWNNFPWNEPTQNDIFRKLCRRRRTFPSCGVESTCGMMLSQHGMSFPFRWVNAEWKNCILSSDYRSVFLAVCVLLSLHKFFLYIFVFKVLIFLPLFLHLQIIQLLTIQEWPATPSCPPPAPPPPLPAAYCATRSRPPPIRSRSWAATIGRRHRRRRACMKTGPRRGPAAANSSY